MGGSSPNSDSSKEQHTTISLVYRKVCTSTYLLFFVVEGSCAEAQEQSTSPLCNTIKSFVPNKLQSYSPQAFNVWIFKVRDFKEKAGVFKEGEVFFEKKTQLELHRKLPPPSNNLIEEQDEIAWFSRGQAKPNLWSLCKVLVTSVHITVMGPKVEALSWQVLVPLGPMNLALHQVALWCNVTAKL